MSDRLTLKSIALDVFANSPKQIMRLFAGHLNNQLSYDYHQLIEDLNGLKANDTATIGNGIALYHGWNTNISEPAIALIRLNQPLYTLNTPDREPVDMVWLLLSPKDDGPSHLARLSRLTRFIKDDHYASMIRGADHEDAVHAIFSDINDSFLANKKEKRAA